MKKLEKTRSNATFASLVLGFGLTASAFAADLKVPDDYPTIQGAVIAASDGDTIRIASGLYFEQVRIISKKLTLIGQPGTILRATETLPVIPGSPAPQFPVMFIRSSEVTVRGLTFEGERLAGSFAGPGELKGIYLRESSANVENCAFYGFRESAPGAENASAITATGFGAGEVNLRIAGCTFADNYGDIFVVGLPDRQSMNVMIENNTIIGPGPLDRNDIFAGIFIREGVGGRIAGNTISGFSYIGTTAEFPISFGIVAINEANEQVAAGILQPLIIEGNTLRDNQVHIGLTKGDGSVVRNNRFHGTAPGIIPVGLAVTGTNVTIADNQFEDMTEGIRLMGNDPLFGTLLGYAVNAQVSSNRFCEVTTPITRQPLASATEVGTSLTCPIPPPPLTVMRAIIVSWPGVDTGWTIESAISPDGPWTASDATPFTQNGRLSIAVPTDGEHLFFRLR